MSEQHGWLAVRPDGTRGPIYLNCDEQKAWLELGSDTLRLGRHLRAVGWRMEPVTITPRRVEAVEGGAFPRQPTEVMLNAARDWSYKKLGKPVGNDDATGCWQAMWDAAPISTLASAPADAYLAALLHYTGNFYGVAIERGIPADQAAHAIAHVESAARQLHALATIPAAPAAPAINDSIVDGFLTVWYGPDVWNQSDRQIDRGRKRVREAFAAIFTPSAPAAPGAEAVEAAYREGWRDGFYRVHNYGTANESGDWKESDAAAALTTPASPAAPGVEADAEQHTELLAAATAARDLLRTIAVKRRNYGPIATSAQNMAWRLSAALATPPAAQEGG